MKKDINILAIETSCDETSIAVVKNGNVVLSNVVLSQIDIHKEFGGVVPEIASRHHIENISYVFESALKNANINMNDIDYIAVTKNPGLIGALIVGNMFANGLSIRYNKPLIEINHIVGHIYSNFIENEIKLPALHLVISGGHTIIYHMDKYMNIEKIGETQDDAIGEAFDKIARVLELEYPGGPKIDKLANEYIEKNKNLNDEINIKIPNMNGFDFSFSGIKTWVINYVNTLKMKGLEIDKSKISYIVQSNLIKMLDYNLSRAIKKYDVENIYVSGGVSANKGIRNFLKNNDKYLQKNIYFPSINYCTDNAAMIGCACYYKLINEKRNLNEIPNK